MILLIENVMNQKTICNIINKQFKFNTILNFFFVDIYLYFYNVIAKEKNQF